MKFTTRAYIQLLELLRNNGYEFCFYDECEKIEKSVILRHDIDLSIEKALDFAILEHQIGVKSTYFILLSTNFYNVFSKRTYDKIMQIISLGHDVGLHFDEKRYSIQTINEMEHYIQFETKLFNKLFNCPIKVVSMHRPSKFVLENDLQFDNIINSYSTKYFKGMKYLSDSRMHWRENPIAAIESGIYKKMHILTHPFWYSADEETMNFKLKNFLNQAKTERYEYLDDNITELSRVINRKEITE